MITFDDTKPGIKLKLFYGDKNINNAIIHILAIIDDDFVVYKTWSKDIWNYEIKHRSFIDSRKTCLSVLN